MAHWNGFAGRYRSRVARSFGETGGAKQGKDTEARLGWVRERWVAGEQEGARDGKGGGGENFAEPRSEVVKDIITCHAHVSHQPLQGRSAAPDIVSKPASRHPEP